MSSKILRSPLPYIALLIAHLIWGVNFVVAKVTLQEFPVMSLAFLRYFFALILILPFFLTVEKEKRSFRLADLPKLLGAGVFMVTFNIAFFYMGLLRTETINASVLSLAIPMISVLGGWWFLKEKIYLINFFGIVMGLLGALVVIGLPLIFLGKNNSDVMLGNLLLILSSISSVIGLLLAKDVLKTYSPIFVTMCMFAVGAVTFFVPALLEYLKNPGWVNNISILGFLGFLYITVLSSICAYFLYIWATKKTDVIQANLFQYLEPAITATLAVPFLGERISYSFIVGTVLVALGVYWGTLGKFEHHHLLHRHHRS